MMNLLRRSLWNLRNQIYGYYQFSHRSYSQNGEDMIVRRLFEIAEVSKPSYLDIGANHPTFISNTMHFYLAGSKGVLVEPNSTLADSIRKIRKRDTVIQAGIGWGQGDVADFYVMNPDVLSTLSKSAAVVFVERGHQLVSVDSIRLVPIQELLDKYFKNGLNILSIDIEGGELQVLESIDFSRHHPDIVIAETWKSDLVLEDVELPAFMKKNGYIVFVMIKPNTIFVSKQFAKKLLI